MLKNGRKILKKKEEIVNGGILKMLGVSHWLENIIFNNFTVQHIFIIGP